MNKLGISPLSPASNPIRTPSTNTLTKSFSIFGDRLVGAYGLVTETFLRERSLALSKSSALAMTSFAPPLPMNNVIEYTKEVVGAIEMNFEEQVIYMVQTMDHNSVGQVPSIAVSHKHTLIVVPFLTLSLSMFYSLSHSGDVIGLNHLPLLLDTSLHYHLLQSLLKEILFSLRILSRR